MKKLRQIIYKKVKILWPHCPVCKKALAGNGSDFLPYQCNCGIWEFVYGDRFEVLGYKIIK